MRERIYVAGPYTKGDIAANVYRAFRAANDLADLGFAPFVPHSSHLWHLMFHRPYEFWTELDRQFLPCCRAVLRLPGESDGADGEVELANTFGIPVFYDIRAVDDYFVDSKADTKSPAPLPLFPEDAL